MSKAAVASSRKRRLLTAAWITAIAAATIAVVVVSWDDLPTITWNSRSLTALSIAVAAALLRRLITGTQWALLVRTAARPSVEVPLSRSLADYFVANMATYLPGKYWFIPARIMLSRRSGVEPLTSGTCLLLEQVLMLVTGTLVAIGTSLLRLDHDLHSLLPAAAIVLLAGLALMHPRVLQWLTLQVARVLKQPAAGVEFGYGATALSFVLWIVVWCVGGVAFHAIIAMLVPSARASDYPTFLAIYTSAWLAGALAPFAPGGLGVREGVIAAGLKLLDVPIAVGLPAAVLLRLLFVFEDLFWAAFASIFLRRTAADLAAEAESGQGFTNA